MSSTTDSFKDIKDSSENSPAKNSPAKNSPAKNSPEYQKALEEAEKVENEIWKLSALSIAYFGLGEFELSNEYLNTWIEKAGEQDAYYIAMAYSFRGEVDQSFSWLEKAIKQNLEKTIKQPNKKNKHLEKLN